MSNETLTKSIEVLEDGKLRAITTRNKVVYIQPIIEVDTLDNNQELEVFGSRNQRVQIETNIDTIDGVAFSGTFEELETEIRTLAAKANSLLNAGSSIAPTPDAFKQIGLVWDLTADDGGSWPGFSLSVSSASIDTKNTTDSADFSNTDWDNVNDLCNAMNQGDSFMSEFRFSPIEGETEKVLIQSGISDISDLTMITLFEAVGDLEYLPAAFTATTAELESYLDAMYIEQVKSTEYSNSIEGNTFVSANTLAQINASLKLPTNSAHTVEASSATVITLKTANASRKELIIHNNSTANLFIKYGTGASLTAFTARVEPQAIFFASTTEVVTGIWDAVNGDAQITETT